MVAEFIVEKTIDWQKLTAWSQVMFPRAGAQSLNTGFSPTSCPASTIVTERAPRRNRELRLENSDLNSHALKAPESDMP